MATTSFSTLTSRIGRSVTPTLLRPAPTSRGGDRGPVWRHNGPLWGVVKKRDTLVDAYLEGRGIDQATFERQTKRLDNDEAELRNRIDVARPTAVNLTRAIDLAQAMLVDLPRCWNRLEPQHRPQFITALYPAGLIYEDGTIGTAENPWWMATSAAIAAEKMGLVPPTGFEPVLPA